MTSTARVDTPPPARVLQMIWLAFLAAIALYTPLPFILIAAGERIGEPPPEAVRSSMSFAALGAGVASVMARRWWTNSVHAALGRDATTEVGGDPWARLRAGCVVTWALSEAVALMGLVLALVTRQPTEALVFVIAGAALLLYHRPSNWPIDAVARAQGQPV